MIDKYEHTKFLVGRFDQYFDSINSKGSFYIGLNTFIFGGICVGYISLFEKIEKSAAIGILSVSMLLLIACVLSIYFTVMALMPFLKDKDPKCPTPSLIFFGGIARHQLSDFEDKFNRLTDADILEDSVQQVHCLAKGLDTKYKRLKLASHFLVAQFIIMLPLISLIILNLNHDI